VTHTEHPSLARGFLFADLRGYSAFVERHGDQAAADLLRAYRTLVRAAVAEFRGAEIRTEGDSFYVVFDSPSAAVRCGLAILDAAARAEAPNGRPIQVGIGVHAGETVETDEGYVGSAVNIAARVCAAAGAGELLVTDAVHSMTRTYLRLTLEPRGRHRLKGISDPVALYRVVAPDDVGRGRPRRSLRDLGRRHARLLAGAVALTAFAVGASVLGAALLRESAGGVDPTATPAVTGSMAVAPSVVATPTGEYPTSAEQALLDRLPASIPRRTCQRATRNLGVTVPRDFWPTGIMPTLAAVTCDPGSPSAPHIVTYWQADTLPSGHNWMRDAFSKIVGARGIPRGVCGSLSTAYGSWSVGDVTGSFLCAPNPEGDLEIMWTYDDEHIIVSAIRRDNDMAVLLSWWEDHRFLTPDAP